MGEGAKERGAVADGKPGSKSRRDGIRQQKKAVLWSACKGKNMWGSNRKGRGPKKCKKPLGTGEKVVKRNGKKQKTLKKKKKEKDRARDGGW